MNFAACLAIALGILAPATFAAPDLTLLSKKLEAEDFKEREQAVAEMAAASDEHLEAVIRYLGTAKMGPEATARIPDILHVIFLRQCYRLGEPETGMIFSRYLETSSTKGVTAVHPLLEDVTKDSPAAKAGLRKGDVIVEWNGKPLEGDDCVGRLMKMIRTAGEGTKVNIRVRRFEYRSRARLAGKGPLQEPVQMTLGAPLKEPPVKVIDGTYAGWLERMRSEYDLPAKYALTQS
jgi:membrane-associated protease RseP (regulator of RpoE activity)